MTDVDLALEAAEVAALQVQYDGLRATYPAARPAVTQVEGLTVLSCAGLPDHPWLHQVTGLGVQRPFTAQALDAALAVLSDAAVRTPVVTVPEAVAGEDLLASRDFLVPLRLRRLVAPAGGPVPESPLRLAVVGPEATADVAAVANAGFGLDLARWWAAPLGRPGWTQVMAYDGTTPVASGGLHVSGEHGWIGAASTVPGARRRGAQSALLELRLHLAAAQGAPRVSVKVEPDSASYRNLVRAGFVDAHAVTQWRRG